MGVQYAVHLQGTRQRSCRSANGKCGDKDACRLPGVLGVTLKHGRITFDNLKLSRR